LEDAILSKKLVQIVTDIDLGHSPSETAVHFYPTNELSDFLKELGFKSALTKLQDIRFQFHMARENDKNLEKEAPIDLESSLFKSPEKSIINIIQATELPPASKIAILPIYNDEDIFARNIVKVFCSMGGDEVYLLDHLPIEVFKNKEIEIISENIKREMVHALIHQFEFNAKTFDIGLAHYNINTSTRHDIDTLMKSYLEQELSNEEETANAQRAQGLFLLAEKFKVRGKPVVRKFHTKSFKVSTGLSACSAEDPVQVKVVLDRPNGRK
jgi:DNA polymerase-1